MCSQAAPHLCPSEWAGQTSLEAQLAHLQPVGGLLLRDEGPGVLRPRVRAQRERRQQARLQRKARRARC